MIYGKYSTGNSIQYSALTYMSKDWKRRIYITESLCCTPEINNIVKQLYSNKNLKINK